MSEFILSPVSMMYSDHWQLLANTHALLLSVLDRLRGTNYSPRETVELTICAYEMNASWSLLAQVTHLP